MSTSQNRFDAIEQIIFEAGLRINNVEIKPEFDKILVYLNTDHILVGSISSYKKLAKANPDSLLQFELIANGIGVHWPELDEDLSLKGLLKDTLQQLVTKKQLVIA